METDQLRLQKIWNQKGIPVVLRRNGKGERLRIRLPFNEANRRWLQDNRRTRIKWNSLENCWEVPKLWFNGFVRSALSRFGHLYVVQPYREQEICAPACWNAVGHECQCSCMGVRHGSGADVGWFEVSDVFATRWGERQLACRLMTWTDQGNAFDQ